MGTVRDEGDRLTDIGPEAIDIAQNTHRMAVALEELVTQISEMKVPTTVNNSAVTHLVEKVDGPNAAGYAMLVGVTTGFAFSLNEILDNPNLDMLQKAKKLREIAARGTKMADEYQQMLDQLRKESEGGR